MKPKKIKSIYILLVFFSLLISPTTAQTKLIKLDTVTFIGVTDTLDQMPVLINSDGNVIVAGNQKMNATQYNATITKPLNTATSAWISQYNTSNQKAFITASCKDNAGNIITVGAIRENSANAVDFLVIKLDSHGNQLWVYKYNGTNSSNDVASAVCTDVNGNIYVTGASDGANYTLIDYATIKLSPNGNPLWASASRYDNLHNIDIPTSISYDNASNCVYVVGSSGTSFTDYDFLAVKYRASDGSQVEKARITNNTGSGQDQTFGLISDTHGNLYITGATYNGSNYDLQLVKLDTAMNQVWVRTYPGHGFDDVGTAVALDGNNNIIVTGTSFLSNGTRELVVLKYDASGNRLWKFLRQPQNGQDAEGLRIQVTPNHEYFIGANYGTGSNQDIEILCLNASGKLVLEHPYDSGFKDRLMDFKVTSENIYVSGRSTFANSGAEENNIAIQYSYKGFTAPIATIPNGGKYVDGEVIISFNKNVMDMSKINDKSFTYGKLSDFVDVTTCHKIQVALDPKKDLRLNAEELVTRKIFFDLTEADSLSETRSGNFVKIPAFYTALAISLPNTINTYNSIQKLNNNSVKPNINYTQLNNVYQQASPPPTLQPPNDMFYGDQASIHPTPTYTAAHCNADSAWSITTGVPTLKVGIIDSGIDLGHEDLQPSFAGYDFVMNTPLANGDNNVHGTPAAGIIGAIRNNNVGIAGIAGGDASTNQAGVTMYDCTACTGGYCQETYCAPALLKAVTGTNSGGYGLHTIACPWFYAGSYTIDSWGRGNSQLTIQHLDFANRNGVVMSFPKGNFALSTNVFPADWSDDILMSVGSNGNDGHHSRINVNSSNSSTQGGQIDFVAPGSADIIQTTGNGNYVGIGGTSMATPHVTGASALMMSYRNKPFAHWDNLVHEDIEHILQRTATDLANVPTYSESPGYDLRTGWGRINIYRAVKEINKNNYGIHHVSETIGNTGVGTPITNLVYSDTMTWTNYVGVPTGVYQTEVYKRTVVINYSLLPSEQIIDKWALNKDCYGTKYLQHFDGDRPNYGEIDLITTNSCTMSTYYYRIPTLNIYAPYDPSQIKSAFTVYTYDPTGALGIKKNNVTTYRNIQMFPNPTTGEIKITFGSDASEKLHYNVFNIVGQEMRSGAYNSQVGKNELEINLNGLTNGVYILSILDNNNKPVYKSKIIKATE